MGQIRKARGISRRKQAVPLQRYMKVAVAYLLLITVIFSNMSNPLMNVFAGQKKEEFRIHADELQRAAEEALEEENVVEEPLEIYTKDASLQKEYDELLAADGTLYEVFPEYERENDLDEIDLRIFLRLSEDADPKSYALTGEETFIFLYVNGGDETVAGRVNIDGYISGVCSLKSYAAVFDKDGKDIVIHSDTEDSTQKEDEIQQAQEEKETSEQKENTGEQAEEKKSHDTAEKDTTNQSDKNDTVNENKSQDSSSDTDTADTSDSVQEDTADAEDSSSDTDTSDQESDTEDTADTDSTDNSDSEDSASSEQEADDSAASDVVASISSHPRFLLTEVAGDDSSVELEETKEEIKAVEKEEEITVTKPAKETEAPVAEAETTVEETTEEETSAVETSAEETLPTETEETTAVAEETKASTEETTTEAQISDLPDDTNTAEEEDEPDFKRVGTLKGETYNLASLDQTVTIRAFTAKLSDMGLDKEELENQGHMIDYMIDPTGSAELVKAPKLARDGAEVTFGVIPQTGYKITEITANGTELEEVETEDVASPSNAEKADNAVYYVIPEVLEDQEVEIFLEEEVPGSHPAFEYAETLNGVTVSISAAEGILPEGTTAKIAEVTANVENAVKEKVESEAAETDAVEVKSVLAYDITLYDAQGNVLKDSWSKNGYVNVSFSGAPIEEKSKEATAIEISHLDTDADTTKGIVTVDEIKGLEQAADEVAVADGISVESVSFEARHFSTYAVTFYSGRLDSKTVYFDFVDTENNSVGSGGNINLSNLISDSVECTTGEIVGKILTSTNQSNLLNEYDFKEAHVNNSSGSAFTKIRLETSGYIVKERSLQVYTDSEWQNADSSKLYFVFEKTKPHIEFNGNGASGTVPDTIVSDYAGMEVSLPDKGDLEKEGYSFVGWAENVSSTQSLEQGKVTIYPANSSLILNRNMVLYAVWARNNPEVGVHFFVRLDATIVNEPSDAQAADYTRHNLSSGMYFAPDKQALKEAKFVTDPTGKAVEANLNKIPTNKAIATAVNEYPVSLNSKYGVTSISENDLGDNGKFYVVWYVVKIPGEPDGYWHVDGVLLKKSDVNLSYDLNCSDWSDGSATPTGGSYSVGTDVVVADNSLFSRPGYAFIGWNTERDGSGTYYDANSTIHLVKTTTLYAQWTNASGGLRFRKVLYNSSASDDISKVTFALYKSDDNWNQGELVAENIHPSTNGTVQYQLRYDSAVSNYLLYETATANGYVLLTEPLKITVTFDSDNSIKYTVNNQDTEYSIVSPYEIVNYAGAILPDTGGQGLDSIHRLGWSVILASVMFAGFQLSQTIKRKREE